MHPPPCSGSARDGGRRRRDAPAGRSGRAAMRPPRAPDSRSRIPAAAAIGAGDDLEQVTVGVFEVEPAAAVVAIDLPPRRLTGIGPVGKLPVADSCEDLVEFR